MAESSATAPSAANLANVLGALAGLVADRAAQDKSDSDRHALALLAKYPGCSIDQLRGPLQLSHSGCVRLVRRLVDSGLLDKSPGTRDARSVALQLTEAGWHAAESHFAERRVGVGSLLDCLTEAEKRSLFYLVCKLLFENVRDDSAIFRVCRGCSYEDCSSCPFRERSDQG